MHKLSYDRNMVQFYGACLDPPCPMLVLEFMEGGDLQSCILQDCYPNCTGHMRWYNRGGRVALDVAKGLVFLHEQKVCAFSHRQTSCRGVGFFFYISPGLFKFFLGVVSFWKEGWYP